jgi:serine O-acetyltransferase
MLPLFLQFRVLFLVRLATNGPRWTHHISRLILRSLYFIEIGNNVILGHSVFFPHPQCIVIGAGVQIGNEVSIGQFSTMGGNYRKSVMRSDGLQKLPRIGSRVMIGPGSVIGGPVMIGDNVIIAANAVVTKDCPSNRIAYGRNKISKRVIEVDPTGGYIAHGA